MINHALFSSNLTTWETPSNLFNRLNDEFHFTIDLCANKFNTKLSRFYSFYDDALKHSWDGEIGFMNPPYGSKMKFFLKKAFESKGIFVCVIPSRTDTKYWHEYVMHAKEIRFIKGRVKFENDSFVLKPAPFPSAIVVFDGNIHIPKISSFEI